MKGFIKGLTTTLLIMTPVVLIFVGILWYASSKGLIGSKASSANTAASDAEDVSAKRSGAEASPAAGTGDAGQSASSANQKLTVGMGGHAQYSEEVSQYYEQQNVTHEKVTISFAGDILLDTGPTDLYQSGGISALFSDELLSEMTGSTIFVVNEEFPFSQRGVKAEDKQYTFRVDPKYVSIFNEIGVDIATLANNHALDYGKDALLDSIDTLDAANIAHVGAGTNIDEAKEPVIVEAGGYTIAFIGASRVIPQGDWAAGKSHTGLYTAYDVNPVASQIKELKTTCDYVFVYFHWGIEKNTTPESYERQMAYTCIDAGADGIIGSHPHVLQGFEYYKGTPIAYSLGNYLFSNRYHNTMLYQLEIDEEGNISAMLKPLIRTKNGQVTLSTDPEAAIKELESLSYHTAITYDGNHTGYITGTSE